MDEQLPVDAHDLWLVYDALHASVHLDTTDPERMNAMLQAQEDALEVMEQIVSRLPSRADPASETR